VYLDTDFYQGSQSQLTSPVSSPAKQQLLTPTKRRRTNDYWASKAAAREKDSNKDSTTVDIPHVAEEKADGRILIKDLAVGY